MVEKRDSIDVIRKTNKALSSIYSTRVKKDLEDNYTDPAIGRLRLAQILSVDFSRKTAEIYVLADQSIKNVSISGFMTDPDKNTGFWYGFQKGDIVECQIGFSNIYYITNKIGYSVDRIQEIGISEDGISSLFFDNSFDSQDTEITKIEAGSFILRTENDAKLKLSPTNGAFLGTQRSSSLNLDSSSANGTQGGTSTLESNQSYYFNNAGFALNGVVLRDRRIVDLDSENNLNLDERIISRWYKNLTPVNFDPDLKESEESINGRKRNPSFVENRSIILEFSDYSYDNFIQSDDKEAKKQNKDNPKIEVNKATSRRIRKEDVLSLSLVSPNQLIEKIEGSISDIYGNLLDINRNILPIGEEEGFITLNGTEENYYKIRELHRKNIAYHWELNARKDPDELKIESGLGDNYALIDKIYKKNRSRMFIDIDKEGQFKFNVPASSEKGNVSVLSRYENYTTVNPKEKDGDYDYDYYQRSKEVSKDILLDSYGNGNIKISGDEKLLPKDRITSEVIKVGTVFHDISTTCVTPLYFDQYHATGILSGPDTKVEDQNSTRNILAHTGEGSIVTKEIQISGDDANAGGRSGTAVFDGMLNVSVGANTVDRQSLWLDTQGGIVQRIGADLNGISMATQTDGDYYLQIGGEILDDPNNGVPDKRFNNTGTLDGPLKTNRFEVRVMQGNGPSYTRILIDNEGVLVCSPKRIEFRAEEDILFNSNGDIFLNGEKVIAYGHTSSSDDVRFTRQSRKFDDVFEPDGGARVIERGLDRRTI
jgi:hypothetical protein